MKWPLVKLGDVCEIIMGQSPPGDTYNKEGRGLPFYQGKIDFGKVHLQSPSAWCTEPLKIAEPGDILISVRAPVGPTNLTGEKCCIGRGLAAIRPKKEVDTWFVFLLSSLYRA
jgi:type I restriction enzyme S subunit